MKLVIPNNAEKLKGYLNAALLIICIAFSPLFGIWLSIIGVVIFVVTLIKKGISDGYILLFATLPFANIFKVSANSLSLITICEVILGITILSKLIGEQRIRVTFFVSYWLYLSYILIFSINDFEINVIIKNAIRMIIIYYFFQLEDGTEKNKMIVMCSQVLSVSMIVMMTLSTVKSYLDLVAPYLRVVLYANGTTITRNCGLLTDPNYCGAAILMTLSFSAVLYYHKVIGRQFWLFALPLIYFGFTTLSRTYFVGLAIFAGTLIAFVLFPKHHFWGVIVPIAIAVLTIFAMSRRFDVINLLLDRMNTNGDLTNGRFTLSRVYLEYIWSHPLIMIFGEGINASRISGLNNVHNIYIEVVFKIGIVGTCLFVLCLTSCFSGKKKAKISFASMIPILVVGFLYFTLAGFNSFELLYYLLICGMSTQLSWDTSKLARKKDIHALN